MSRVVVVVALVCALLVVAAPAAARPVRGDPPPTYAPPVDAPVVDPFRAPSTPYGAGNRGLEYDTAPGDDVRAIGDGEVTFAGAVGGELHVTVRHPDGLRSTYSFLARVLVARGDRLARGDLVGIAGERLHLGVRDGTTYIDPASLVGARVRVRLVPLDDEPGRRLPSTSGGGSWGGSSSSAQRWLDVATGSASAVARWGLRRVASVLSPATRNVARVVGIAKAMFERPPPCSPPSRRAPVPAGRRVAVLVGGLGSSSSEAAIDDLDTATLGYAATDVLRFSYRGGRVPDATDALRSIGEQRYDAGDTQADVDEVAGRLASLIEGVAAAAPDATIDLLAHSQGGIVLRLALEQLARDARTPERLGLAVTLATPHGGAPLADGVRARHREPLADPALEVAMRLLLGLDPDGASFADLSTPARRPIAPPGATWVAIGARGDLVVPAPDAQLRGATNVTVGLAGVLAHDELPRAPAVTRELALALAGLAPACESATARALDIAVGGLIDAAERGVLGSVFGFAA